jgi:predicted amidohydrolase
MRQITVACCQLAPLLGQMTHNRQLSAAAIRAAAQSGAQVIVLPELVSSGYRFSGRLAAHNLAEEATGPSLRMWEQLARELDVVIIGGFCERLDGSRLANSAALIDSTGVRAIYRKAHLWDEEKLIFAAWDQPPPIVETAFGRLSMMLCYDLEFPEWVRLPALDGAELLCAPVNWPATPRPPSERPVEVIRVQANASVNRMFIAACDRCGTERGTAWVGGSVIVDTDGYPLAGPMLATPGILLATLPLAQAGNKFISSHNHVLDDRRPALYRAALDPADLRSSASGGTP